MEYDVYSSEWRWVYRNPRSIVDFYVQAPPGWKPGDLPDNALEEQQALRLGFEDERGGIELQVLRDWTDGTLESDALATELAESFEGVAVAHDPIIESIGDMAVTAAKS
jgi:hypothetical protein